MNIITLTNNKIDLVKKFKGLPTSDQECIIKTISDLLKALQSDNRPSREKITEMLLSTEQPEITRACYMATLAGVKFGNTTQVV
jgi:hypothetical protein